MIRVLYIVYPIVNQPGILTLPFPESEENKLVL